MQRQGVRIEWLEVPGHARAQVEAAIGSEVIEAVNERGGFSPGVAARCQLADGRRCFIKSVSADQNPMAPLMHRQEGVVAAALPHGLPVPALWAVVDDGVWITLVFEEVRGHAPAQPWSFDDLAATFRALDDLTAATTPCPITGLASFGDRYRTELDGFRRLAARTSSTASLDAWTMRHLDRLADIERDWEGAAIGDSLVHSDLRADNLLVTEQGDVVVVDWPHACTGASWLDKLCMLPSIGLDGGPSPGEVEAALHPFRGVESELVDRVAVALTGYFTHQGALPDPVGLPTVRAFQRAQAEVARPWLAERLDLR